MENELFNLCESIQRGELEYMRDQIKALKPLLQRAYESGYEEGKKDSQGIVGESLPTSGMDFFDWWDETCPLLKKHF